MLSREDIVVIEDLKRRLIEAGIPLRQIRVYGSRSRGEATSESDMDVFLILDHVGEEVERKVSSVAWEVGFDHSIVITTVEYTDEEITASPLRASPFIRTVMREGIAV